MLSDGTYRPLKSGAAWIITTEKAYSCGNYICGKGFIGDTECDSHRAECYGILGGLLTWEKFKNK
jgi:hypothetical protein